MARDSSPPDSGLSGLLDLLRSREHTNDVQGGIRRTFRMARVAAGTGLSLLGGRLRGRGSGGLDGIDLRTVRKLVTNLGELKGLAMKFGQILSYIDVSLPPEMRELLAVLQTQSQPTAFDRVAEVLREDLGPRADQLLATISREPVSVASIGQVHRGTLPDGTAVAVKVLHPGIRRALESDFSAARLGPVFAKVIAPSAGATVEDFIGEMKTRMLEECDYALEADRQERFSAMLSGFPRLIVPAVHRAWCSSRVLVTTWEPGRDLESFLATGPSQEMRDHLGEMLFEIYFGTLYRHGLFHADPHPGNYAFREDGTIVVYDFGCAREFDRETVRSLARLAHAVAGDREAEIREAFDQLGGMIPPDERSYRHVHGLLRGFFSPLLTPGRHVVDASVNLAMGEVVKDKRMLMRLRLPGKMLFLFRIRFGLYAVLARLRACCDWSAMEHALAEEALGTA